MKSLIRKLLDQFKTIFKRLGALMRKLTKRETEQVSGGLEKPPAGTKPAYPKPPIEKPIDIPFK